MLDRIFVFTLPPAPSRWSGGAATRAELASRLCRSVGPSFHPAFGNGDTPHYGL